MSPKAPSSMKIVVMLLLLAVVASLFSGLFFIYKDKGESNRAVISLTIRVVLSIAVFLILIGSYYFGLLPGGKL
jgi:heme/copper-type cytochrome/quinol oxidase subunit 4